MSTSILDFTEENGLVLCHNQSKALNSYEKLYLAEVSRLNAQAVFFRRYFKENEDSTPYKSEPCVVIFEEAKVPVNSQAHKEVHAALWSEGRVDVYIIKGKTFIDIYTARQPAEKTETGDITISEALKLAQLALGQLDASRFSARLFGTGTFWEQQENQNAVRLDKSPYKHLVDYLMEVRWAFIENTHNQLEPATIDKILVLSILVKFLEDKKDDDTQRSTLDDIYSKLGIENLEEAVRGSKFLDVLEELANEFNGRIFDQFTPGEKTDISRANLGLLSDFLSARIDLAKQQLFLWEQYSFKHLPAEVISAIYENFIQEETKRKFDGAKDKGVVYTPIHLVNFLVDEVMPLDSPPQSFIENGDYKVLDPTCGSGVFLVAAYKRLLQWWAIAESQRTGRIKYPDKDTAQRILEDNIYGVDVKDTAVFVTIFGLTTALLDHLTPKEVWGNLKFKDLSKQNVVQGMGKPGFFSWALNAKKENKHFALAIGNPPFNSEKGVDKKEVLLPEIIGRLDLKHKHIPRGNFALHFFEVSMLLVDRICMIIPSNVLLYDKSASEYRKDLFTNYSVSDIYDFTHLRESLFVKKGGEKKTGRTPVVALLAENKPSEYSPINHTVVKRTVSLEQKIRFEIDHYDRHLVKWSWAVDPKKQFVWKTNLLGGGRLFHLIYKMSLIPTLLEYIEIKKRKDKGWIYSSGYKIGGGSTKKQPASYIHGQKTLRYDRVSGFRDQVESVEEFEAPRSEFLYAPPLLVFAEILGKESIPIKFFEHPQPFNISFVGIHGPDSANDELRFIQDYFNQHYDILKAYMLSTSSKLLINKETTFVKEDLDTIPFSKRSEQLLLNQFEKLIVDDVLRFNIHLGKAISNKSDGAILHHTVKEKQLLEYGETLCQELNDIYERNGNSWQAGKISRMPSYTVYQIGFGKEGGLKHEFVQNELDKSVETLINNDIANSGAAYKRIVRLYDHVDGFDCVFFIKPNALRYWLKSIALRDADETFADFKKDGY